MRYGVATLLLLALTACNGNSESSAPLNLQASNTLAMTAAAQTTTPPGQSGSATTPQEDIDPFAIQPPPPAAKPQPRFEYVRWTLYNWTPEQSTWIADARKPYFHISSAPTLLQQYDANGYEFVTAYTLKGIPNARKSANRIEHTVFVFRKPIAK